MNGYYIERLATLLYWVKEREEIRLRKEGGDGRFVRPFPWTDDPILREWRFCCVRREDDRVTRWIRTNIRERFAGHKHLWWMLCAARIINWPPTLERLMNMDSFGQQIGLYPGCWPSQPGFSPTNVGEALEDMRSMKWKVFTGAYVIPAPTVAGQTKGRYVAEVVLGNLWHNRSYFVEWFADPLRTISGTHKMLMKHQSWGPFLAYQAVVDMRFTPLLSDAPDVHTWCACGLGTVRGLNRLYGRPPTAKPPQEQLLEEVRLLWPLILRDTGINLDFSDVPNVLCEYSKMDRILNGGSPPRARYVLGRGC